MARMRTSKHKMCRRAGVALCESPNCPVSKRPYPPGEHGRKRRRPRPSQYEIQLREKQKLRYTYGVLEKQFRKYFHWARKTRERTGEKLLQILEARLDNVVYRLGFAPTRPAARQLVNHGHIEVNDRKVNIPSYAVSPGETVRVREKSRKIPLIQETLESGREVPEYLELDRENFSGRMLKLPEREQISVPVDENLIVEFYSR